MSKKKVKVGNLTLGGEHIYIQSMLNLSLIHIYSGSQVNRKTYKWRTPQYLEALKRATSGKDYEVVKE